MTMREAQPEDAEALKARAMQIYERAWNEGKFDGLDTVLAPNVIRHEPPNSDIVGLDAYKQFILIRRAAFPDATLRMDEAISEGATRAGRWTFQGTNKGPLPGLEGTPTGKQITMTGLFFVHTIDDRHVEEWVYGDTMGMLEQLGLLPPKEA